ncbi:MAG: Maf family nucleotide pyrophosphatase [Actinomycetota bacterium]
MKVVLASRSPQRRELLERLGLLFEVVVPEVEEVGAGDPADAVLENARRKAAAAQAPDALVIGCDTDVVVDGRALGKPSDQGTAREYLELLSGRSHEVLSGLVLLGPEPDRIREGVARTVVTFRTLGAEELDRYLSSDEWRERAGGYAIQGLGSTLAERVEGDLANVIGLPLALLLELAPELAPS